MRVRHLIYLDANGTNFHLLHITEPKLNESGSKWKVLLQYPMLSEWWLTDPRQPHWQLFLLWTSSLFLIRGVTCPAADPVRSHTQPPHSFTQTLYIAVTTGPSEVTMTSREFRKPFIHIIHQEIQNTQVSSNSSSIPSWWTNRITGRWGYRRRGVAQRPLTA